MALIQEAHQLKQERKPKLEKIEELFNKSTKIVERKGKNLCPWDDESNADGEYTFTKARHSIDDVNIDLFGHYKLNKIRFFREDEYKISSITISIKDLHREILLKKSDTKIYDSSVNPEEIKSIDEFTKEDLDPWKEIIDLIEREIKE